MWLWGNVQTLSRLLSSLYDLADKPDSWPTLAIMPAVMFCDIPQSVTLASVTLNFVVSAEIMRVRKINEAEQL